MGWLGWKYEHWWLLWLPCMRREGRIWHGASFSTVVYSALTFGAVHLLLVTLGLLAVLWETRSLAEVLPILCV